MKVWLVALMFLLPLALSARAVNKVAQDLYYVEEPVADPYDDGQTQDASEPPGEPLDVATWLAVLVGWVGILVVEVRMNEGFGRLLQKVDQLERYVNTRDNLLALRIDELAETSADDADGDGDMRRPPNHPDDWKRQRRH
jgi:hypothetical protein